MPQVHDQLQNGTAVRPVNAVAISFVAAAAAGDRPQPKAFCPVVVQLTATLYTPPGYALAVGREYVDARLFESEVDRAGALLKAAEPDRALDVADRRQRRQRLVRRHLLPRLRFVPATLRLPPSGSVSP